MQKTTRFKNKMTVTEKIAAWIYLPVHVFVLPIMLGIYAGVTEYSISEVTINIIYYCAGIVFILLFMRNFLFSGFNVMLDNKAQSLVSFALASLLNLTLSYVVVYVLTIILGDFSNPNNDLVTQLSGENMNAMIGISVFLAPIIEESLFRGFVFGSLHRRSRALAYIVCVLLFSVYHIWQYVLIYMDISILLLAIQYVPVSLALCWCYERSGSIWVPIFLHMTHNALAFFLMGM